MQLERQLTSGAPSGVTTIVLEEEKKLDETLTPTVASEQDRPEPRTAQPAFGMEEQTHV
jgi:hypothetical protein